MALFRAIPSVEFIDKILKSLRFSGIDDKRWFSKEDLPLDNLEEWLAQLEPYYLPCKAVRYIHGNMTKLRIITILRHILKVNNIELKVQERFICGKKTTIYQIFYMNTDSSEMRFD